MTTKTPLKQIRAYRSTMDKLKALRAHDTRGQGAELRVIIGEAVDAAIARNLPPELWTNPLWWDRVATPPDYAVINLDADSHDAMKQLRAYMRSSVAADVLDMVADLAMMRRGITLGE